MAWSASKILYLLFFFLGEFNDTLECKLHEDCLMIWAVFRSQHTYSNDFNIWTDCQRIVSVLKKKTVNKKQNKKKKKANEEKKIFL